MVDLLAELDRCSRCGLCLSVCPTYEQKRVEMYAPRGRIALMKAIMRGAPPAIAADYVASCLQCGTCQSVCPTDVPYSDVVRAFGNLVMFADEDLPSRLRLATTAPDPDDPAHGVVVRLMCEAISDGSAGAEPPLDGDHLLVAGAVLTWHDSRIVEHATVRLRARGLRVARSDRADRLGLPWLENGGLTLIEPVIRRLAQTIAASVGLRGIVCLDTMSLNLLRSPLLAHDIRAALPPITHVVDHISPAELLDTIDDPVVIDRTAAPHDAQFAAAAKQRPGATILPQHLWGAGAAPLLSDPARPLMGALLARKTEWLARAGAGPLLTLNPLTLIRHGGAMHALAADSHAGLPWIN